MSRTRSGESIGCAKNNISISVLIPSVQSIAYCAAYNVRACRAMLSMLITSCWIVGCGVSAGCLKPSGLFSVCAPLCTIVGTRILANSSGGVYEKHSRQAVSPAEGLLDQDSGHAQSEKDAGKSGSGRKAGLVVVGPHCRPGGSRSQSTSSQSPRDGLKPCDQVRSLRRLRGLFQS